MEVKKPGLCVQDGKKTATETDDLTGSNSVSHSLTLPEPPIGGQKGGVFGNRRLH